MKVCVLSSDFRTDPQGGRDLPLNRIISGVTAMDAEAEFHVVTGVREGKKVRRGRRLYVYPLPDYPRGAAALVKKLDGKIGFDVIHGFDIHPDAGLAVRACRALRKPCMVGVRGSASFLRALRDRPFLDMVSGSADSVVFVSRDLMERFARRARGKARLKVILNSTELVDAGEPGAAANEGFVVGNVSFLADRRALKGAMYLLEAFRELRLEADDARLVIIGVSRREGESRLHRFVKENGLEGSVTLHEIMPHRKVLEHLRGFDVYVSPSLFEGIPGAVLEAMMMRKPVLATDVGGVGEVIDDGKNGMLAMPFSGRAIFEKLLLLYRDAGLRRRLGDGGRKTAVERFSPEREVREWHDAYKECAGGAYAQ
jgi:glycosyltransferase involved in cell wall biosynthesis